MKTLSILVLSALFAVSCSHTSEKKSCCAEKEKCEKKAESCCKKAEKDGKKCSDGKCDKKA